MIWIIKKCEKELRDFPVEVGEDLADALALLGDAFKKKSQQTPKENIELAKQRLKGVL